MKKEKNNSKIGVWVFIALLIGYLTYDRIQSEENDVDGGKSAEIMMAKIHENMPYTFYCGCKYRKIGEGYGDRSSLVLDEGSCDYRPRRGSADNKKIVWHRLVPRYFYGVQRQCWKDSKSECKGKGEECISKYCEKTDNVYKQMNSDMHNMFPVIDEIDRDRSFFSHADIDGEQRIYGGCNVEINYDMRSIEPREEIKGDIGRAWLHMIKKYKLKVRPDYVVEMLRWSKKDRSDDWERVRNERIYEIQGDRNDYIY